MIAELDVVALTRPLEKYGLEVGDIGAAVLVYSEGVYEVEFVAANGETIALETLTSDDVRPVRGREILHTRLLAI
jgi:hypothetical protein